MVLRVGSLGSCRVRVPLKIASANGRIRHIPPRGMAYAHNPLEMIQGIRLLKGEMKGPPDPAIANLTAVPHAIDETRSYDKTLGRADVIVCELSSIRVVQMHRWQLQLNYFHKHFQSQRASGSFEFRSGRDMALPLSKAATLPDTLDRFTSKLIRYGSCYEMDQEEIEKSVVRLIEMIGKPILFVCAFVQRTAGGEVTQRVILRDAIKRVADKYAEVALFDPSVFLSENPSREVFKDYGHYADEFVPVVADRLVSETENLWNKVSDERIRRSDPIYMLTGLHL